MRQVRRLLIPVMTVFVSIGSASSAFSQSSQDRKTISSEEREALVTLYEATGGAQWTNQSGWLGPSRTECDWYGVTCNYPEHISTNNLVVVALDLSSNNLVGAVPPQLGLLTNLDWLSIYGNHLTGILPEPLIQRWLAGPLHIAAEGHLLTSISKIDYESDPSGLLCGRRRTVLGSDQVAHVYTTRCRNASRRDRATYCEVQEGQVSWGEFARLAWMIEKSGFFSLQPEYFRSITHAMDENTRVIRSGKNTQVSNYATAGPMELWQIQRAIEGVGADMEVTKTSRQAKCPRW